MSNSPISRRSFLKSASVASAVASFPAVLRSQSTGVAQSPNNKLNIALIGVGGRGRAAVTDLKNENYVAFCDVDEVRAAQTFKE